jgi:hypothetical protein
LLVLQLTRPVGSLHGRRQRAENREH